ncbi:hypothetical protein MKW94_000761 [Papaver nudicaule]|uniref:Uncharacterized protein n=1 Tax=Papaver nudicaule TaxID=74823 RepID=A0AA41V7H9_PAPNU|nr:hypothetical protein [Papaver nudicaule]
MESSVGFMTVFAVSGSVVLVALQAHKRLLSDFMKKVELELGTAAAAAGVGKVQQKKKVRFADDVIEPSSNNKEYRKQRSRVLNMDRSCNSQCNQELENTMPENRRALYKGIVQSKIENARIHAS